MSNVSCQDISHWSDSVFATAYGLTSALGLPLNTLALLYFFRCAAVRSHTTVYMKNLACADLLLAASLPVRVAFYAGAWHPKAPPRLACEISGMVFLINMYASIFFLACISLDRCAAICFPMKSRLSGARRGAPWYSALVWLVVVGASLPPYLYLKLRELPEAQQNANTSNISCIRCFEDRPAYVSDPAALAFALLNGCVVPLATVLACSLALLRSVRRSPAARQDWPRVRNTVAVTLAVFALCFLPYHMVLLLMAVGPTPRNFDQAYHAAVPLACLNTVLDPVCYYFATETFQKSPGVRAVRNALITNTGSDVHQRSRGNH
ncbi:lysophosphatidic acid receptor 6-like [Leucoraja erinacea]|uniref:lysophosphatidic acid receptor 6-like n=1 Tax=Leucoraja erinaceus TaxID=7782 RepID=UPI00245461F3|nr:lysophosphatidic acid receptor 6-like [Leucoraja erinacea]